MLYRTNRTLSANLNGLNLGTRSLAILAGEANGKSTLRIPHAHGPKPMRDGMFWSFDPPIRPSSRIAILTIPGSSLVVPGTAEVPVVRQQQPVVGYRRDSRSASACLTETQADQGRPAKSGRHKALRGRRQGRVGNAFAGVQARAAAASG